MLLQPMHKKFEINRTKIEGGCQSVRKVVPHNSKSDLALEGQPWLAFLFSLVPELSSTKIEIHSTKGVNVMHAATRRCDALHIGKESLSMRDFTNFPETFRFSTEKNNNIEKKLVNQLKN